ncbi:MAG: thermonuclease family protein [Anaerolineae bacterium]|nr:thermonuclease family protein [Anaerolineae bacterium]
MRKLLSLFGRLACNRQLLGVSLFLTVASVISVGCSSSSSPEIRRQSLPLPTQEPTVAPSPSSTRVMPIEVLTPPPTATITPIPDEALGLIVEIIDGNTLAVILDGDPANLAYTVKLLGIDAPAIDSPWGMVAYETNQRVANLKVVRLVKDKTDYDEDGNLLRYIYIDNQMLNILLVERGLANAQISEPDTRFETEIEAAEARAQEGRLGLWSQQTPTPTLERVPEVDNTAPTATPASTRATSTDDSEATEEPTQEPTETATAEPTTEPTSES